MTENDRKKFTGIMQAIASTFSRECDEPMLMGYWLGLCDIEVDTVNRAAMRAIRECKRMPTVHHLRELAGVISDDARALLAWQATCKAITDHGRYQHVDFDDRIINATIRTLGGWPRFIDRFDNDREQFVQRDFERTYKSLQSAGVDGEITRPLSGLAEAEVGRHGLQPPTPQRIETGLPPSQPLHIGFTRPKLRQAPARHHGRSRRVNSQGPPTGSFFDIAAGTAPFRL